MSQFFLMCVSCYCYAVAVAVVNMFYGTHSAIKFLIVLGVI